jgi:hypothetical protein
LALLNALGGNSLLSHHPLKVLLPGEVCAKIKQEMYNVSYGMIPIPCIYMGLWVPPLPDHPTSHNSQGKLVEDGFVVAK